MSLGLHFSGEQITSLCREMVYRGWWVTAADRTRSGLIIGFDFLPRRRPNWLKAFDIPFRQCNPEGVEQAIREWREDVLRRLDASGLPGGGELSPTVRRLLAEHGADQVRAAMTERPFRAAA